MPRPTLDEVVKTNANAERVLNTQYKRLQRFFQNNKHLLSKENKSVYKQCKELSERYGLVVNRQTIHGYSNGLKKTANTYIVYLIADYWHKEAESMLTEDFSKVA